MRKIFISGIAVADLVFELEQLPFAPVKHMTDRGRITSGGCAANAAVAVARLGGRAALGARVGDDLLGALVLEDMAAEGVDTASVHRAAGGRTSFSAVCLDAAGERLIVNYRGRGLDAGRAPLAPPADADAALADTRWLGGLEETLAFARRRDIPGIVDAERLGDAAPPTLLMAATHVAFSKQGLLSLTGGDGGTGGPGNGDPGRDHGRNLPRALAAVRRRLAPSSWACVTDGGNGVFFTAPGGVEHLPAFAVTARDTLAAGDIWHGAFALRLAEGANEEDAMQFACAAAALKCAHPGGRDACPNRPATEQFLRERAAD